MNLPREIILEIVNYIKDIRTLCNFIQTCKYFKEKLIKEIKTNNEHYYILPNGKKHGSYIKYRCNGRVCVETNYINGEKHGLYKKYYHNGQIKREFTCMFNKLKGPYKKYDSNGNIITNIILYKNKEIIYILIHLILKNVYCRRHRRS
jgi:antitoxin component YwqK of YwqJK toxin-antitoxin module